METSQPLLPTFTPFTGQNKVLTVCLTPSEPFPEEETGTVVGIESEPNLPASKPKQHQAFQAPSWQLPGNPHGLEAELKSTEGLPAPQLASHGILCYQHGSDGPTSQIVKWRLRVSQCPPRVRAHTKYTNKNRMKM